MGRRVPQVCLALALGAPGAATAGAQSHRTLDVARQLLDSTAHRVEVAYTAGELDLAAAPGPLLFQMQLRYDEARARPVHRYAADANTVALGVARSDGDVELGGNRDGELRLGLTPVAPLDLDLDLGVVQADLDLGGLAIETLALRSGASEVRLRFGAPNRIPMRSLAIDAGVGTVRASSLANANLASLTVDAGVGSVSLDFGGEWQRDLEATVDIVAGSVTVHVPRHVGVRVDVSKVLASFEHDGLVQRGGSWYSTNWDAATHHLRLDVNTTFGRFELDRTAP